MILILLMQTAQVDAVTLPGAWATFTRAGALSHVNETVEIATDNTERDHFDYKLRFTRTTLRDREILWTNSRTCPAVRPMLQQMRDIAMPRPAPYGVEGEETEIVMDGAYYELQAPSNFSNGNLTITSNVGSPLATWVDDAFVKLAACWSKVELRVAR